MMQSLPGGSEVPDSPATEVRGRNEKLLWKHVLCYSTYIFKNTYNPNGEGVRGQIYNKQKKIEQPFSSVQSLSRVRLFATPETLARQASNVPFSPFISIYIHCCYSFKLFVGFGDQTSLVLRLLERGNHFLFPATTKPEHTLIFALYIRDFNYYKCYCLLSFDPSVLEFSSVSLESGKSWHVVETED